MTDKSFADRLFDPARRARNRWRARTAWLGAKGPAPAGPLPEARVLGDADRGAALVRGGAERAAPEDFAWLDDLAAEISRHDSRCGIDHPTGFGATARVRSLSACDPFELRLRERLQGKYLMCTQPRFEADFLAARWGIGREDEPWHYRYVGNAAAAELRDSGVSTLEEFFELPAAPNY